MTAAAWTSTIGKLNTAVTANQAEAGSLSSEVAAQLATPNPSTVADLRQRLSNARTKTLRVAIESTSILTAATGIGAGQTVAAALQLLRNGSNSNHAAMRRLYDLMVPADSPPIPEFVYGITVPACVDPLNPTPADTVGWDGNNSGGTYTSDLIMPSGATWTNREIFGNVTMPADGTGVLENCIIYGSTFTSSYKPGLVRAAGGGTLRRCTIWGTATSVSYYTNGISHTAGTLEVDRCVVMRVVDGIHTSGNANAKIISKGNLGGRFAFFDNDADHPDDPVRPYYTHNDFIQVLTACTQTHEIYGDKIDAFFDTTGVVWSGGTWGSGTASGGEIGMPSTALNAGYWSPLGKGTWCNGITFSNQTGHRVSIKYIWIDGVNASSGLMQWTKGTTNVIELAGNRFGLGGKPSGSGKFFLVSYPPGNSVVIGTGEDANVYGDYESVPVALRGKPLTFTAGGASVVP